METAVAGVEVTSVAMVAAFRTETVVSAAAAAVAVAEVSAVEVETPPTPGDAAKAIKND